MLPARTVPLAPEAPTMAVDYRVDPARRLVIAAVSERFSRDEVFQIDHLIRSDPAVQPEFNQLLDLSEVTENVVDPADLRELNQRPPFFSPRSRRAVVGANVLVYGKMRMFELLRGGIAGQWRYFTDREAAEQWLGEGDTTDPSCPGRQDHIS
jgi:hypothetical protein